jgi:hypothetical protein
LNLEHLSNFITNNYQLIQQNKLIKNRLKIYIKNYFFILNLKLKKLKLGLVNFEIKQFFFANIFLYDTLEMRYIRQDTTEEDEMSLEHRLEAIKWKWDFKNVAAFLLIAIIVWFILKNYLDITVKELFYTFYDTEKFDQLTTYTFQSSFENKITTTLTYFNYINKLFVTTLLTGFMHFKLF